MIIVIGDYASMFCSKGIGEGGIGGMGVVDLFMWQPKKKSASFHTMSESEKVIFPLPSVNIRLCSLVTKN